MQNIIRGLVLFLVQVFLLNNLHVVGLAVPFVYVLFIMMMPYQMSRVLLLLLAFGYGSFIDVFSNTLGLHAASLVFLAFLRPGIINAVSARDYTELAEAPDVHINGFLWILKYTFLSVLVHHVFLYFVEAFSFNNILETLLRIIVGTLVSTVLIIVILYLTSSKKAR